jgi:hypothetical protein
MCVRLCICVRASVCVRVRACVQACACARIGYPISSRVPHILVRSVDKRSPMFQTGVMMPFVFVCADMCVCVCVHACNLLCVVGLIKRRTMSRLAFMIIESVEDDD